MQKVVLFNTKKHIWSNEPDVKLLNEQLDKLHKEKVKIKSITTNTSFLGTIKSFTILLEDESGNKI